MELSALLLTISTAHESYPSPSPTVRVQRGQVLAVHDPAMAVN